MVVETEWALGARKFCLNPGLAFKNFLTPSPYIHSVNLFSHLYNGDNIKIDQNK